MFSKLVSITVLAILSVAAMAQPKPVSRGFIDTNGEDLIVKANTAEIIERMWGSLQQASYGRDPSPYSIVWAPGTKMDTWCEMDMPGDRAVVIHIECYPAPSPQRNGVSIRDTLVLSSQELDRGDYSRAIQLMVETRNNHRRASAAVGIK